MGLDIHPVSATLGSEAFANAIQRRSCNSHHRSCDLFHSTSRSGYCEIPIGRRKRVSSDRTEERYGGSRGKGGFQLGNMPRCASSSTHVAHFLLNSFAAVVSDFHTRQACLELNAPSDTILIGFLHTQYVPSDTIKQILIIQQSFRQSDIAEHRYSFTRSLLTYVRPSPL
jgi:hypothetical protein